ncbi:MAG TPA: hypothetical protein VJM33_16995, partial [Microthrixaceae bacterium]|nr:hypothetical protein [Microthrixaceae bacterium]
FVDDESFHGKVVGGVVEMAETDGVASFVVAGDFFDGTEERVEGVSLVARYGMSRAKAETLACVEEVVAERLSS